MSFKVKRHDFDNVTVKIRKEHKKLIINVFDRFLKKEILFFVISFFFVVVIDCLIVSFSFLILYYTCTIFENF
jgi:hypothetical protein